jgi:hypothetical protein
MKRSLIAAAAMVLGSAVLVACSEEPPNARETTGQAATQVGEPEGRIVFARADPSAGVLAGDGDTFTYTLNADGTDEQPLFSEGPSGARGGHRTALTSISSVATTGWRHTSSIQRPASSERRSRHPTRPWRPFAAGRGHRMGSASPARCSAWTIRVATGSTRSAPPTAAASRGSRPSPEATTSPATTPRMGRASCSFATPMKARTGSSSRR